MDRENRMEDYLMGSECSVGEAVAENGGSRITATEEFTSSAKRRRMHDSEIIDFPAKSVFSAATALLVVSGESSCDYLKATDLKGEEFETAFSTFSSGGFSRETSSSIAGLYGEASVEAMDLSSSTSKKKSLARKPSAVEMPSTAEMEEFFSAAEKSEQERFVKKYNYDIVKDVPLQGRYQWIPLKL